MVGFPGSKINLGLQVLRKRSDGYHDLRGLFIPLEFSDVLEIVRSDSFHFTYTGQQLSGDSNSNLVVRAYHLLQESFGIAPVSIHLHKVIPEGSGLGAGSADGTKTLLMLNELCDLQLEVQKLFDLALQLGSDCPFFLTNEVKKVEGRGEQIAPFRNPISGCHILVIVSKIKVSTNDAFSWITPVESVDCTSIVAATNYTIWQQQIMNDFEKAVFEKRPELKEIKQWHYENGAVYASMTGSGCAVYGIYETPPRKRLNSCFCWAGRIV